MPSVTSGPGVAPQPTPALDLSATEARRLTLRAQALLGVPDRRGGPLALVRTLGGVQLDTISVLARSHELVAYARLGAVGRPTVEAAYWGGMNFEYWAHAACVLPISHWPLFAFRRRHYLGRQKLWGEHLPSVARGVLERIRAEGPMSASDLGGAKKTTTWWGWSDVKSAAEFLLASGQLVSTHRVGWRRVYDLPERALPADLLHDNLSDDECLVELTRGAAACLGVGTAADLADYFRLKTTDVVRLLPSSGLTPVMVHGWRDRAWADPAALAAASVRGRHRTTLLSPFDSLVWDRKRTARVFGVEHRLEAYVPKAQRQHGYFTMPVLAGGELIARVDPARAGSALAVRQVVVEPATATAAQLPRTAAAVAVALREAAGWVGCTDVAIERVTPVQARPALIDALR